jgi:hypothetical protein
MMNRVESLTRHNHRVQLTDAVTLLCYIPEVPGSNSGQDTVCRLRFKVFRGFLLSLQKSAGVVPQTWLRTHLFTSFPLHYALIILPFGAILCAC